MFEIMTGKEIYDLIKGLDAGTKKSFARYCKTAYSSSGWLHLYRQIAPAKTYDEAKIRGRKLHDPKDYWLARMQLLRQLISSIYLSRQEGDLLGDDRLQVAKDHCMFDFLVSQVKREFIKAKENGKVWRIMELEEIRENLRMTSCTPVNEIFTDTEVAKIMEEVQEIATCKQMMLQYRIYMKTGSNNIAGRQKLADQIEHRLSIYNGSSPDVCAYRLRTSVGVAILRMEYDEVAILQEKLVCHLLSSKTNLNLPSQITEISSLITIFISLKSQKRARGYLSILRKIEPETEFERQLKKRVTGEAGISLAAAELDLELFKISFELVGEAHIDVGYYQVLGAKIAFYTGEYTYSMQLIRALINLRQDIWAPYAWYLLPLEAIIRYEQNDYEEAVRLISRIRTKKSIRCEYVDLMLSTIESLIGVQSKRIEDLLMSSYQKFTAFAASKNGIAKTSRFDFGIWLHSKMSALPNGVPIKKAEQVER